MATHPFDAYLAAQPAPQRRTLETIAARLRTILPGAEECISYGMPAFKCDGTAIAGFAGFVRHCSYFPHSGAVLPKLTASLTGYDWDDGTLRFPVDQPLPTALLRELVATRLQNLSEEPPKAGKVRRFHDNGRLESKGGMKGDQLHGAWAWYRKDGSLQRTGQYQAGVEVGTWRTFNRNGAVLKETVR
ncbi:MAG: DUF1801 domain-containing protein [Ilumatobacteraceae bacterium]